MKPLRTVFTLITVVALLFASVFCACAIGFEAEKAYESVFVIYSGNSLGSGFAVGENCIVTNAHVISNPRDVTIATYGGKEYRAGILGMDEELDIAVLAVEGVTFPYLQIADLGTMKTGDDIYAIGAPKGMAYTLTKGGISAKEREVNGQVYIQIDAPINKGNSGGPLLNDSGHVLGMNTLKMNDSEGLGLAIPVTRICAYLRTLGIALDAGGNVENPVDIPDATLPGATEPDIPTYTPDTYPYDYEEPDRNPETETPDFVYAAVVIAALSLGANVWLAVLLIHEKKKNVKPPFDPRERTDFDIDLLE